MVLTAQELVNIDWQGLVHEDVLDQIFDISPEELAFMDLVGAGSTDNKYFSWVTDKLKKPAAGSTRWVLDGADIDRNDASNGNRIGNHTGIMDAEVQISHQADAVDTIGKGTESAYQVNKVLKELKRQEEFNLLSNQGSTEEVANTTPGVPAGFGAMCRKYDNGSGGSGGVFSSGNWSAWTAGTKTALTETHLRDAQQAAWMEGGNPAYLVTHPNLVRGLSEYMFTSSSRIATLTGETNNRAPGTAMGTVNVFLTDFGQEVRFVPNRWHPTYQSSGGTAGDATMMFLVDPEYVEAARLRGYMSEGLAKTGHSNKTMISVHTSLRLLNPDAMIAIPDVDHAAAVTQA